MVSRRRLLTAVGVLLASWWSTGSSRGGIGTWGSSEAAVARALAMSLGAEPSRGLVEEESHSTSQNAQFSVVR